MPEVKAHNRAENPYGKRRTRENAYAVYASNGWTWYVLKVNQTPEKAKTNPYASADCCVVSPYTGPAGDYGATYLNDIGGAFVSGVDILKECGRR